MVEYTIGYATCDSSTSTGTADGMWNMWYNDVTTAATVTLTIAETNAATWGTWTIGTSTPILFGIRQEQENEEQIAARELATAQRRAAEALRVANRLAAEARAKELLVAHLSEEERAEFEKEQTITLVAKSGRKYLIRRQWGDNVIRYSEDGEVQEDILCVHADRTVPYEDNMLAQVLTLRFGDEEALVRAANRRAIFPRAVAV